MAIRSDKSNVVEFLLSDYNVHHHDLIFLALNNKDILKLLYDKGWFIGITNCGYTNEAWNIGDYGILKFLLTKGLPIDNNINLLDSKQFKSHYIDAVTMLFDFGYNTNLDILVENLLNQGFYYKETFELLVFLLSKYQLC